MIMGKKQTATTVTTITKGNYNKCIFRASSTHQKDGRYFNAQYNGGQAAGQIAKDTVRVSTVTILFLLLITN